MKASVVIEPTSPLDQKTRKSPPDPIMDRRTRPRTVAENEREREWRERNADLLEHIADDAEAQHQPDIEHAFWMAKAPMAHDTTIIGATARTGRAGRRQRSAPW